MQDVMLYYTKKYTLSSHIFTSLSAPDITSSRPPDYAEARQVFPTSADITLSKKTLGGEIRDHPSKHRGGAIPYQTHV